MKMRFWDNSGSRRSVNDRTSTGFRFGLDGPFFFGRTAILCLAAEWLSFVSLLPLPFSDISGKNSSPMALNFPLVSYSDLLVERKLCEHSSYDSELAMLSRPSELCRWWWLPRMPVPVELLLLPSITWWSFRGGVDGLRGNPKSSSEASDRLFRLRRASANSACAKWKIKLVRLIHRLLSFCWNLANICTYCFDKKNQSILYPKVLFVPNLIRRINIQRIWRILTTLRTKVRNKLWRARTSCG